MGKVVKFKGMKDRDDLVEAWKAVQEIAKAFPEDSHWADAIVDFKAEAERLKGN